MTIPRISTIAFFIIRLPAAVVLSIIIYALWRLTLEMSVGPSSSTSGSAKYLFIVMGFFTGFSAGKVLTYFEKEGFSIAVKGGHSDN